jgi:hypothetical protein
MPLCTNARPLAVLVLLASPAVIVNPSVAQQPSPEQIATIRQACRSDFISHCSGVQPGGREALQCLQHNVAQLSAACSSAITAAAPKSERPQPIGAASQPQQAEPSEQEQLAAVRRACTLDDFVSHCSWITPSSPELLLCFRANAAQLSAACQNVLHASAAAAAPAPDVAPAVVTPSPPMGEAPAFPTAVAVAPPPPPPPAAAAPRPTETRQPSAKQVSAVRAACRSDFISHCSGVQPGSRAALQCLERNTAEVSKRCQDALAGLGGSATGAEGASASPSPNTATLPAPESFTLRRLGPRQELPILRTCAADVRSMCRGIPPGGGRIIGCLARNGSQLSRQCRDALAELRE